MAYDKKTFLSGMAMGLTGKGEPTFEASDVFGKGYLAGAKLRAKRLNIIPGAVWFKAQSVDGYVLDIFYFNEKVVVIMSNNDVYASEDGKAWELLPATPCRMSNLTCANGMILGTNENTVYCTSDLVTWNSTEIPLETTTYFDSITYGGGRFLLMPCNQLEAPFYSDDGLNWTQLDSKICPAYGGFVVRYLNGRWYGHSTRSNSITYSVFYRSEDGINWTRIDSVTGTVLSLKYANGLLMLSVKKDSTDEKTKDYYYSTDGITWTVGTIFGNLTSSVEFQYAGGLWFADNYYSGTYCSSNGIDWEPTSLTDKSARNVAYGNGVFVASLCYKVEYYGIAYSTDGVTWTHTYTSDYTANFVYADGVFVAFGLGILYSTDGVVWKQSNITESATSAYAFENVGLIGAENARWPFFDGYLMYTVK